MKKVSIFFNRFGRNSRTVVVWGQQLKVTFCIGLLRWDRLDRWSHDLTEP